MKPMILLAFLLLGLAANAQPKDAPMNVPVGTIDTFWFTQWALDNTHYTINLTTGDTLDTWYDSTLYAYAVIFQLVDNRKLVPYCEKGPCRPVGKLEWVQNGAWRVLFSSQPEWLPVDYPIPADLKELGFVVKTNHEGGLYWASTKLYIK